MSAFVQTLRNLGPMRLAAMAGVAVLLVGFFIFLTARLSSTDMTLLYRDLDLADSGAIATRLEEAGVPFEVHGDGAAIHVPTDQVDRLRLMMAQEGLPKGGSLGYEIFDRGDGFGTTNFVQNINRLRALEGELARTIGTIDGVRQARVHLVLPERELFSRDQQEPSASVFLRLETGGLASEQVLAVQHLVAAAVPQLEPDNISVVDHNGSLLARGPAGEGEEMRIEDSEEMRLAAERRLTDRVEELLSRTIGYGKVRAKVAVDMDFDRVTTTNEMYDPDVQVPRSSQLVEEESESREGDGLDPVTVANNLPEEDADAAFGGPTASSRTSRLEETVNYEINRQVVSTVRDTGTIRRLSVAVLVDGTYAPNADGVPEYAPRGAEEMAQIEALVRSAVGFNAARGDTIEVVNMPFVSEDARFAEASAGPLGLTRDDMFRLAEMAVLAVVAVLVMLLVVRPLLTRMLEGDGAGQPAGDEFDLLSDPGGLQPALAGPGGYGGLPELAPPPADGEDELDQLIDLNQVEGRVRASSLKKVGEIVEKHPEEAVAIIRGWMHQET